MIALKKNMDNTFSHLRGFSLMPKLNMFDNISMFIDYMLHVGVDAEEFELSSGCFKLSEMSVKTSLTGNTVILMSPMIVIGDNYFVRGDSFEVVNSANGWNYTADTKLKKIAIHRVDASRLEYDAYFAFIPDESIAIDDDNEISNVIQSMAEVNNDITNDTSCNSKGYAFHAYSLELTKELVESIKNDTTDTLHTIIVSHESNDFNYFGNAFFITDKDMLKQFSFIITERYVFTIDDYDLDDESGGDFDNNTRINKIIPAFEDTNTVSKNLTAIGYPEIDN